MNNVVAFKFEQHSVRTVIDDLGEPWWVAKDICEVLGHSQPSKAVAGLDEDEVKKVPLTDSLGRPQETFIVSESGTYALVIRSNKPQAKLFRKWITSEVLPTIRKTGRYDQGRDEVAAIPSDMMLVSKDQVLEWKDMEIQYLKSLLPKKREASRPLTEEEVENIIQLNALGVPNADIARQVRRSPATVSFVVRGAGVAKEVVA